MTKRALKPSTLFVIDQPRNLGVDAIAAAAQAAGYTNITRKHVWAIWAKYADRIRRRTAPNGNGKAPKTTAAEALKVARAKSERVPDADLGELATGVRRLAIRYGTVALRAAITELESDSDAL